MDRIFTCESLLKRNKIEPFLKRLVTSDEKWMQHTILMFEKDRGRSKRGGAPQMIAKPRLMLKKVMLCVWWEGSPL